MSTKPIAKTANTTNFAPAPKVLLQRKCACGNHTNTGSECANCATKKLQRKLSIGATHDPLELEADRVADQVLAYQPAHSFSNISAPKIQRRAEQSSQQTENVPASVEQVLTSSGSALPPTVRNDMEQRFGQDFSQVRMHTGSTAEQSARDVNANAYTVGNNIVFNRGKFSPETQSGKHLLAHELTHVVQQSANSNINATMASQKISRSPNLLSRQVAGATKSDPGEEAKEAIANAALGAGAFGIKADNPLWGKLNGLWMVQLLQILEDAAKSGQLNVIASYVDSAGGGVNVRLRLAIDAVIIKLNNSKGDQIDSKFVDRLAVLKNERQMMEIVNYLKGSAKIAIVVTPPSKDQQDFLTPKKTVPPQKKPAQPDLLKMLPVAGWEILFIEGLRQGLTSDAKLQAGIESLKQQVSTIDGKAKFAVGAGVGLVTGAVEAVADIPYSLLKAYIEFELHNNFNKMTKDEIEAAIEQLRVGIRKLAARMPELLIEVATQPQQVGNWTAQLISEKIRHDLLLEEPEKKTEEKSPIKNGQIDLSIITLPDLYKMSQDLLTFGKPNEKNQYVFNRGVAFGMALGYSLMNIAMLFIGPEEIAAKAGSMGAKGFEAVKASGLWKRLASISDTIPELKGLLSAKKASAELKAAETIVKDGEIVGAALAKDEKALGKISSEKPKVDPGFGNKPLTKKSPGEAVKFVDENPNLIKGESGHKYADVGEGHNIIEVPDKSLPGGIGCELHSPPPFPKVPCPKGMGGKAPAKKGPDVKLDPLSAAHLQYRENLIKRFPKLKEAQLTPIKRNLGEPGLWEESIYTGSGRQSWSAKMRDGKGIQLDDIDTTGVLVDTKMRGIDAGREIRPDFVPDAVDQMKGSATRTYDAFPEKEQSKLLKQLRFSNENGLNGVRWETNSAELKAAVERYSETMLAKGEQKYFKIILIQR